MGKKSTLKNITYQGLPRVLQKNVGTFFGPQLYPESMEWNLVPLSTVGSVGRIFHPTEGKDGNKWYIFQVVQNYCQLGDEKYHGQNHHYHPLREQSKQPLTLIQEICNRTHWTEP